MATRLYFVVVKLLSHPQHLEPSWTLARQAPLSTEFSRQEYWTIPISRVSSQPRGQTQVSLIAGRSFTVWAIREVSGRELKPPLKDCMSQCFLVSTTYWVVKCQVLFKELSCINLFYLYINPLTHIPWLPFYRWRKFPFQINVFT